MSGATTAANSVGAVLCVSTILSLQSAKLTITAPEREARWSSILNHSGESYPGKFQHQIRDGCGQPYTQCQDAQHSVCLSQCNIPVRAEKDVSMANTRLPTYLPFELVTAGSRSIVPLQRNVPSGWRPPTAAGLVRSWHGTNTSRRSAVSAFYASDAPGQFLTKSV